MKNGVKIAVAAGILSAMSAFAVPILPTIPKTVFDITNYGAVADGSTDNAASIQKAIKAASAAGGGIVEIPAASKVYLAGPITLASRIHLQVDAGAELQALPFSRYPLSGSAYGNWITASGDSDVELSGKGVIDGNGYGWWPTYDSNSSGSLPHRPYLLKFDKCVRIHIHQLTVQNSPMFHLAITANEATIDSVLIQSPDTAKNTDAIDPAGIDWLITQDSISVGDDDVAVKAGSAPCKNFVITHLRIGGGHGISVGGQSNDGLDSMRVDSCRFNGTTNGLRLKANRTNGGLVQHLSYSNITMNNVKYPFYITSYYSETTNAFTDPTQSVTSLTPIWKDITFTNITSTGTQYSLFFEAVPEMPIDTIILKNVTMTGKSGYLLAHVHNLGMSNVTYNGSALNTTTNIKQQVDVTWMTVSSSSSSVVASSSSVKVSSSSVASSSSVVVSSSSVAASSSSVVASSSSVKVSSSSVASSSSVVVSSSSVAASSSSVVASSSSVKISSSSVASSSSVVVSSSSVAASSSSVASSSSAATTSIAIQNSLDASSLIGKPARFQIYSVTGNLVREFSGTNAGRDNAEWLAQSQQLLPGVYIVRVIINGAIAASMTVSKHL